ncbi:dystroglycan isoform X2 [Belonocnema kinseyi]|uniref:dystroglycan isoform X2 n=1 Tax=Belonocnema kinseyi TaxID=2817044 RepID=UPI00143DC889|nr:dystroglycan isoform X2 [Belonocnema kinseyi]
MKSLFPRFFVTFLLFLPHCYTLAIQTEDDLVFDDVGEEAASAVKVDPGIIHHQNQDHQREQRHKDHRDRQHKLSKENTSSTSGRVERLWGMPDVTATQGHVFKMKIPKQAFGGNVQRYEAHGTNNKGLPNWLYWDEPANTLLGVPSKKDIGQHRLSIKAFGKHGDVARDFFTVQVLQDNRDKSKHTDKKSHCEDDQDQTLLTIILDAKFENLKPEVKVEAIENFAGFLGLHTSAFSIHPQSNKENSPTDSSTVLIGPGNVKHRKEKHSTVLQWQVGCDGRLWKHQAELIKQLPEQAKDGTLAEVLQLPVLLWRVKTDAPATDRNRRDTGSGDFANNEDYDGYDDEDNEDYDDDYDEDDNKDIVTEASVPAELPHVSSSTGARVNADNEAEHPHRHHHGEETIDLKAMTTQSSSTVVPMTTTVTTPGSTIPQTTTVTVTQRPMTTATATSTVQPTTSVADTSNTVVLTTFPSNFDTTYDLLEKIRQTEDDSDNTIVPIDSSENATTLFFMTTAQPSSTMDIVTTANDKQETKTYLVNVTTEEPMQETVVSSTKEPTTTPITTSTTSTAPPTTTTTTKAPIQTQKTLETPSTTEIVSTLTTLPPLKPTVAQVNTAPVLRKRLQKIRVFAGKTFTHIISNETFRDEIDGYTRNLHLSLEPKMKWIEFNNKTQEIYGIPLVEDISTHNFRLTATNSRDKSVTEEFPIYVQQPSKRVEFEFHLYLDILHPWAFRNNVDWEFKAIRNLAQLFGNKDNSHITITAIHIENDGRAILSWTNDTLSTFSECPVDKIDKIVQVLVDREGNPSRALKNIFLPEINVTNIINRPSERSQCSSAKIKYSKSESTTENPVVNLNPILRNQIDRLNCTVGQLFVFKVPDDTFFDTKDGSTRNLNLSLKNADGTEISPDEWLQFDSKNQEFYGVPMKSDDKSRSYMLEARDKEGLSARDSLKVNVYHPPPVSYSVEFSMTLEIPYDEFVKSAKRKRLFIEKVCELFGDRDTSTVSLESITRGSTVVTWRNKTLATSRCPNEDIDKLRRVVVKEDKTLTDLVDILMGGNDFPVKQITLTPLGSCLGELTGVHTPDSFIPSFDDSRSVGTSTDDYLITFVLPAIIILAMLVLAGIIACIFYKRRRSGKMSVSEQDDERQSFRNKGIPVIFQDEFDEKPDPGNKSPIILKEEKPPLPPPEYQKTEDGADVPMLSKENSEEPYQPPPPFASNRDNNRQNRPKPTPTYRKPPPYVPP